MYVLTDFECGGFIVGGKQACRRGGQHDRDDPACGRVDRRDGSGVCTQRDLMAAVSLGGQMLWKSSHWFRRRRRRPD